MQYRYMSYLYYDILLVKQHVQSNTWACEENTTSGTMNHCNFTAKRITFSTQSTVHTSVTTICLDQWRLHINQLHKCFTLTYSELVPKSLRPSGATSALPVAIECYIGNTCGHRVLYRPYLGIHHETRLQIDISKTYIQVNMIVSYIAYILT